MAGCAFLGVVASGADVYVSPHGSDADDGSAGRPVVTLRRALDVARRIRVADGTRTGEVVIELAGGRYELQETIVIAPEDSGTEAAPTLVRAAAGERPELSGGRVVSGWQVTDGPEGVRWTVTLADVAAGRWNFAQLFVNDQRRFRPVVPAKGWFTIAAPLPPSKASQGRGHDRFACAGTDVRADWANLGDVEIMAVHRWTMSRLPIGSIGPLPASPAGPDGAGSGDPLRCVTLAGRTRALTDWCSFPAGNRFRAENVREALGAPGTWYLDRSTGTLTYCPKPGEMPENTVVVAPLLDTLLRVVGDPASERWVQHVRLEGLSFAHGNWTLPPGGQSFPQAEINCGAAVEIVGARHIAVRDTAVRHVGRYAISLGAGCRDCVLERCELVDLGAGGVLVGTAERVPRHATTAPDTTSERDVMHNTIRECSILHGGRVHSAAVGVWIGHASHTTVESCDIADFTYTGVSVGWSWGYAPTRAHHNKIRRNHIHHLGHGVLSDMGGVYTLGVSPGTVIEGNVIHDVESHTYGGWGLYTDEGSTDIVMRDNLVSRTSSGGFHQHYGRDNLVENNIFAQARDWQLQRTRVEDHLSFTFRRNIVWWDSAAPLVKGDWGTRIVTEDNCYWNAAGPVIFPGNMSLTDRQAAGQDHGSLVADPAFVEPTAGNFTLPAESPVMACGFRPFDVAKAGRVTPRSLTADLPDVPTPWPEARGER